MNDPGKLAELVERVGTTPLALIVALVALLVVWKALSVMSGNKRK